MERIKTDRKSCYRIVNEWTRLSSISVGVVKHGDGELLRASGRIAEALDEDDADVAGVRPTMALHDSKSALLIEADEIGGEFGCVARKFRFTIGQRFSLNNVEQSRSHARALEPRHDRKLAEVGDVGMRVPRRPIGAVASGVIADCADEILISKSDPARRRRRDARSRYRRILCGRHVVEPQFGQRPVRVVKEPR